MKKMKLNKENIAILLSDHDSNFDGLSENNTDT